MKIIIQLSYLLFCKLTKFQTTLPFIKDTVWSLDVLLHIVGDLYRDAVQTEINITQYYVDFNGFAFPFFLFKIPDGQASLAYVSDFA